VYNQTSNFITRFLNIMIYYKTPKFKKASYLVLFTTLVLILQACSTAPITGRKQLLLVPESQAINASAEAYVAMLEPIEKDGKLDNDPKLKARVDLITGKLIAQAIKYRPDTKNWNWSVHVIDEPAMVNAWCMAGGRMAIYTGLINQIKPSDDELAQVMGHEIAHALAKHTAEKMSVAMATNMAVQVAATQFENQQLALQGAALAASVAITLPNSRTAESESDRIGIEIAAKAGYDPRAAATLWEKMGQASGGSSFDFLSTHPAPSKRMKTLRELAPSMMPYYEAIGEKPIYKMVN